MSIHEEELWTMLGPSSFGQGTERIRLGGRRLCVGMSRSLVLLMLTQLTAPALLRPTTG